MGGCRDQAAAGLLKDEVPEVRLNIIAKVFRGMWEGDRCRGGGVLPWIMSPEPGWFTFE